MHAREDEKVFSFDLTHEEGNLPLLSIDIRNPQIGLLAPDRQVWAWFSVESGGQTRPIFFGRLVGLPSNLLAEAVTLQFTGRPSDFVAQKHDLAETLKVAPYYDPIWIAEDKRDDPDTILEAYTASWHVDRVTHLVTISDMIFGEDGTEEFLPQDAFYDSVQLTFGQAPQTVIEFEGEVNWTQAYSGGLDMGHKTVNLWNGDSWLSDWPKAGASFDGGWKCVSGSIEDVNGTGKQAGRTLTGAWQNRDKKHKDGDVVSFNVSWTRVMPGVPNMMLVMTKTTTTQEFGDPFLGTPGSANVTQEGTYLLPYTVHTSLVLGYDAKRGRKEKLRFTMVSDLQDIVTTPEDDPATPEKLSMSGTDVGLSGDIDVTRRSFFTSDRGVLSMQYPMLVARAKLLQAARAVKVEWDCTMERALNLSCRKNGLVHDRRLPGGQAFGKITSYSIKGDGDKGELIGHVTISCTIGRGNSLTASSGQPSYVALGYVDPGYQYYSDTIVLIDPGDIGFTVPPDEVNDDGVTFPISYNDAVLGEAIHQGELNLSAVPPAKDTTDESDASAQDQVEQVGTAGEQQIKAMEAAIKNSPTWYELRLRPLTGDFESAVDVVTTTLVAPRMIDLEAPSNV